MAGQKQKGLPSRMQNMRRKAKYLGGALRAVKNKQRRIERAAKRTEKKLARLIKRGDIETGSQRAIGMLAHINTLRAIKVD